MNILVIEDDQTISSLLGKTLTGAGYTCEFAYDGEEGEELFDRHPWDLVLLDLMLPKVSGYDLLEYIVPSGTPVIIISAMGQVNDRVRGLKMGADDYICKPFQVSELLARIEAVIRRTAPSDDVFEYKGVVVNSTSRMVTKDAEEVALTVKEFDLLSMLINNRNVALSRKQLYEYVWKEEYYGETRTLDNHIKRLRQKLGYDDVIKTVFGIGYRFEVPEVSAT
ncbi:MAG: response regulator transcription factor [Clostridiales bacterium]|nr:response regulator transcription factor [Clostridiales bacterium]